VTLQDLNLEHMSSYLGYYISRTSAAGTLINHDPHQTLQWFGFNGDAVRTLLRDYNVPELRKFGLMLKCELEEECNREPTIQVGERMELSRLTKVFMRFIKRVTELTNLPNGWVMPYQIKMVSRRQHFKIQRTNGSDVRLQVTPNSNGTKEITRNLTLIMISALEMFDPPLRFNDSTINYPRFSQQCKTMDSQPNPQHNLQPKVCTATYQYLLLSKALMQDPRPIVAKFYLCPRPSCRFPYNLMDIDRIKDNRRKCVHCEVKSGKSTFTENQDA